MRHSKRHAILSVLLAAAFAVQLAGCSDSNEGVLKENQPPRVWLSSAPPEGTTEKYTVQLFWGGWDPDGDIAYYEYAITDNEDRMFDPADTTGADKWFRVSSNDSTFLFTADQLSDSSTTSMVSEFTRSHTFFVRAVDEQGLASREPAYRSFTSRTLSPEVRIEVPRRVGLNPALVPPITTFRWTAIDYVDDLFTQQEPESVQYALVPANDGFAQTIDRLRTDPDTQRFWRDWQYYKAPEEAGKQWTTDILDFGPYIFAIRAKDEAGAVTPVLDPIFNVRRLRVSNRSTGPLLTLRNQYLGSVVTLSCNTPLVILDLPAGVPLQFNWEASAEDYGGLVSGYRYGWDIADLDDPDQWEIDYTPFTSNTAYSPTRTFFFGTHTFTVEVVDNSGYCSRAEVKVNIIQFQLQKNVILVDDFEPDGSDPFAGWFNIQGRGILPNDDEHDAFWEDMLGNVAGFNPDVDHIQVRTGSQIPLTQVANYKNMVWSVYSDRAAQLTADLPLLYSFIQFRDPSGGGVTGGKRQPNLLALYMAAGGHVFISGRHPVSNTLNRTFAGGSRYPFIPLYEHLGEQEALPEIDDPPGVGSFTYQELCLDALDYSISTVNTRRYEDLYCDIESERRGLGNVNRDDTMREGIPIDPNFPVLTLRPEAAGFGKAYQESEKGYDVEVYNPQYFLDLCEYVPSTARDCFEPIYGLGQLDTQEVTYGEPVAFWTSAFADRVAEVPGAIGARSVVFGFPPVYFNPNEVRGAIEYILFEEWQLPRLQ